jgi:hypothetical protein
MVRELPLIVPEKLPAEAHALPDSANDPVIVEPF